MTKYSRRHFLKQLGAFAALSLAGRGAFSSNLSDDLDFLVVGDSIIWGQGLREEEKFYFLIKQWLEREASKKVNLNVKAHSGASIDLRQFETEALRKASIAEDKFFHREVNISFPSIRAQVDAARGEYENPQTVDLIMLTGGITDVRLSAILNPLKSNDELKTEIVRHCSEGMFGLLKHISQTFPSALIVVVGYYPFISKHTPASKIFNNLLEIYDVPSPLKALINNPLNRQLLYYYRKKMVKRSMIWWKDSTVEFKKAVDRFNAGSGKQRAVFIESPIREENSIGAKNPLVYEVGKKGKAADALASERESVCGKTLDELRKSTKLKFRARTCELATIGHPNPEGSKAYAEAIKEKLAPILQSLA